MARKQNGNDKAKVRSSPRNVKKNTKPQGRRTRNSTRLLRPKYAEVCLKQNLISVFRQCNSFLALFFYQNVKMNCSSNGICAHFWQNEDDSTNSKQRSTRNGKYLKKPKEEDIDESQSESSNESEQSIDSVASNDDQSSSQERLSRKRSTEERDGKIGTIAKRVINTVKKVLMLHL